MLLYIKAYLIAAIAHRGQKDLGGSRYFNHCKTVARKVKGEELKAIALLHDVFKNTNISAVDLWHWGIPESVIDTVFILTREQGEDYLDYINRVSESAKARKVKIADLKHNLNWTRLNSLTDKDWKRITKYKQALYILEYAEELAQELNERE